MTKKGFTYIEVMITLAVLAVLFVPMMRLFSYGVGSSAITGEMITAVSLARWEMERVKNLNIATAGMQALGEVWTPAKDDPPLEMDNTKWRIVRRVSGGDPLQVMVDVYLDGNMKKPVASLVTLLTDSVWVKERGT